MKSYFQTSSHRLSISKWWSQFFSLTSFWRISTSFLPLIFCACQQMPKKSVELSQFRSPIRAKAKVQLKDLRKGDVHYLDVDILAQQDKNLRMDMRATLGILVASIALQNDQVSYLVPQKKSFYTGVASDRSFKPLGALQLHPKSFYSLIFDRPLTTGDWQCQLDAKSLPQSCESATLKTKVVWLDRTGGVLRVQVSSLTFEMTWVLKSIEADNEIRASDFNLKIPESFTTIQL